MMRSCSTERRETPSWIGILPLLLCLSPFLVGEDLQRWRIETDDKWLIYTPKNRIDIDEYPAIPDHLRPFKDLLENVRQSRSGSSWNKRRHLARHGFGRKAGLS